MPLDVVEALEQDLCEPVMDSGSGLVPTLLDDVEQDLAVPCTLSQRVQVQFPLIFAVADRDGEANTSQQDFMSGRRHRVRRRLLTLTATHPWMMRGQMAEIVVRQGEWC